MRRLAVVILLAIFSVGYTSYGWDWSKIGEKWGEKAGKAYKKFKKSKIYKKGKKYTEETAEGVFTGTKGFVEGFIRATREGR